MKDFIIFSIEVLILVIMALNYTKVTILYVTAFNSLAKGFESNIKVLRVFICCKSCVACRVVSWI